VYNYTESIQHMGQIKAGDTIEFEGKHRTVCKKDIRYCSFMGVSIFGSTYIYGRQKVKRINIITGVAE